jgi:hypothetical protein
MYTVDKSVPIPKIRQGTVYPFAEMEVGDSFFVPVQEPSKASSIRACASAYGKKNNVVFSCKQVEGGVRVWRVE